MKRKSQNILILVALAGVAATGFLLFSLFAEDSGPRRLTNGHASAGDPSKTNGWTKVGETFPDKNYRGTIPGGGPNSAVRPGAGRKPFDAPGTAAERSGWTTRVVQILGLIQNNRDVTTQTRLYRELQQLIRKLGHRVPQSVRDDLLGMLTTVDPTWRALIGDTIGGLSGDTETAKKLIEMLNERPESVRTRDAILRALGKMNVREAVPELNKMLLIDFPNKDLIVRAIGNIGGREASTLLSGHLTHPLDSRTRQAIERALSRLRDPVVLKVLVADLVENKDARTRRSYFNVLGTTRDVQYAKGVRDALRDEADPRARKAAIRALGLFGDPESGKALLEMIQHGSATDRTEATRALYHIRDSKTVQELAKNYDVLSKDAKIAVMGAAARVAKPGKELYRHAKNALHDDNRRLRSFGRMALGRRGNDDAVNDILQSITRHPREYAGALQAFGKIATRKAAEAALTVVGSTDMHATTRKAWVRKFEQIIDRFNNSRNAQIGR